MVQRFFRGKKERDHMHPLREAQRKDAPGVAVLQTVRPAAPGICWPFQGAESIVA